MNTRQYWPTQLLCLLLGCSLWASTAFAQWKDSTLDSKRVKRVLRPQKIALLIGIHHYKNPHWDTLKYTRNDTLNMANVLRQTAHFDRILIRNHYKNTTKKSLLSTLRTLKGLIKSSRDTVFVYISGHGSVAYSPDRKRHTRYIVTSNTTQNVSKTALSVDSVLRTLDSYNSKQIILFLATCYTGAPTSKSRNAPGTKGNGMRALLPLRSRAVQILSASGYAQPAFESSLLKGDVYTHYFMSCLKSINRKKGAVSAIEAHLCATKPTTMFVRKHRNEIQVPQVDSQPGANKDIHLISKGKERHGYLVTPSLRTRLYRFFIRRRSSGRKGAGALIASANETIALPPGRYTITQRDQKGRLIKRQELIVKRGQTAHLGAPTNSDVAQAPTLEEPHEPGKKRKKHIVGFGIDLVPFIGTSGGARGSDRRLFSLNILGGYSGGLLRWELSGIFSVVTGDVVGTQIAGALNYSTGSARGFQLAGATNIALRGTYGAALSGGLNYSGGEAGGLLLSTTNIVGGMMWGAQLGAFNYAGQLKGLQLAAANYTKGPLMGGQIGAVNMHSDHFQGVQFGGANINAAGFHGVQVGAANINTAGFYGAQVGAFNLNVGNQHGAQVGAININTGSTKGFQVGAFNVARRSNFSLGVFSVVTEGRTHADAWIDETGTLQAALKHGGDYFHTIVGIGAGLIGEPTWHVTLGYGGHIPLPYGFFLDIDLSAQHINENEAWTMALNLLSSVRVVAGWRALPWLSVIAGLRYSVLVTTQPRRQYGWFGETVFLDQQSAGDVGVRGWPGFILGLQFL